MTLSMGLFLIGILGLSCLSTSIFKQQDQALAQQYITTIKYRNLVIDLGNGVKTNAQLTYPALGKGPFPGVLLIHGSGPGDKNETVVVFGHENAPKPLKPFWQIAVPIGNIMISGTSSSNTTNHCTVSIIINGIKPYQQATSAGNKGPNDYSNWTFSATQKYSTIKEGTNKITAKYSCPQNTNLTKFYSVKVTGVAAKAQQPISPTPTNNTKTTGSAFPPSLPSLNTSIINESKPSNILRGFK